MAEAGGMHREELGEVMAVVHRKEEDRTSRTHLRDKANTMARNRIHCHRTKRKIHTLEDIQADSRPRRCNHMGLWRNQRNRPWIPWLSPRPWHI